MQCVTCGTVLTGKARRSCSKRCNDRWRATARVAPFTCTGCGADVLVPPNKRARRHFCSRACARATNNRRYERGPGNPRWRGGRALSYGPDWRRIKQLVRERDRVCRHCGKTPQENGRALDVHHLDPFRFSGNNDPDTLVALCRSCHMRADDHGRRGTAVFLRRAGQVRRPTKREIRRLRAFLREAERAARRKENQREAERLAAEGASLRQIAMTLGVSHQTVANWLAGRFRGNVGEPPVAYLVA